MIATWSIRMNILYAPCSSTFRAGLQVYSLFQYYKLFLQCLLLLSLLALHSLPVAASQVRPTSTLHPSSLVVTTTTTTTTTQTTPITTTTQQYLATTTDSTTIDRQTSNISQQTTQRQPISYKFTLLAGKLWRFNLKANTFSFYKQAELRLHKNYSLNNYIIDDDGWFQYDHQLQQLFAWPSLTTKQGTYYFVLLPSGLDLDADSENAVNLDIVANIVVELIRPIYGGSRGDIDQLIDHKFSLDYLHRHSSYPLLMQQIVSVFNSLSGASNHTAKPNIQRQHERIHSTTANSITIPTSTSITTTAAVNSTFNNQVSKSLKPSNKLSEYLLISFTYSSNGEYFSITWAYQPSLVNNLINPIIDCRLSIINETILRLSSLTSAFRDDSLDDKYVIFYEIEPSKIDSNSIVPTEHGNYALKLTLRGPCQREKVVEILGIKSDIYLSSKRRVGNREFPSYRSENPMIHSNKVTEHTKSLINKLDSSLPEALNSTTTSQPQYNTSTVQNTSNDPITTVSTLSIVSRQPTLFTSSTTTTTPPNESDQSLDIFRRSEAPNLDTNSDYPNLDSNTDPALYQSSSNLSHVKQGPQAKSFVNYFDSNDTTLRNNNITMPNEPLTPPTIVAETTTMQQIPMTDISSSGRTPNDIAFSNLTTSQPSDINSTPRPNPEEASLTDDFLNIISGVADHLVSIAVPISSIIGAILFVSIVIALCNLRRKRRKARRFGVNDRFSFRYCSEKRAFLKSSSKPVILEADQKSLSTGGTPVRKPNLKPGGKAGSADRGDIVFLAMQPMTVPK